MATLLSNSGNLILSLKVALISTGVLSLAVILKLTVPLVTDFAVSEVPSIYTNMSSLLRPPYLYLIVNCIIISIVASSKLHQKTVKVAAADVRTEYVTVYNGIYDDDDDDDQSVVKVLGDRTVENGDVYGQVEEKVVVMDGGGDVVLESRSVVGFPQRSDSMEFVGLEEKLEGEKEKEKEKPLVSARFNHRKTVKANPEAGKALGVSKSRRHDTLESTWKTITEGRAIPLNRHLKKSDTWDTHVRHNQPSNDQTAPPKMKKSETFSDHTTTTVTNSSRLRRESSGKLRREPSLSQDELNKRVEAFINKFNEEMRLQRQESLNQYQEMLRRGAH